MRATRSASTSRAAPPRMEAGSRSRWSGPIDQPQQVRNHQPHEADGARDGDRGGSRQGGEHGQPQLLALDVDPRLAAWPSPSSSRFSDRQRVEQRDEAEEHQRRGEGQIGPLGVGQRAHQPAEDGAQRAAGDEHQQRHAGGQHGRDRVARQQQGDHLARARRRGRWRRPPAPCRDRRRRRGPARCPGQGRAARADGQGIGTQQRRRDARVPPRSWRRPRCRSRTDRPAGCAAAPGRPCRPWPGRRRRSWRSGPAAGGSA